MDTYIALNSDEKNRAQKKRSYRSMTKEELRSPKLQNMAANEQQGTEESVTEPSLSEIKKMLIDIQSTTYIILSKYSPLAAELAELKNAFESQKRELSDTKKLDDKTMSLDKTISEELKQTRKKINDQVEEIVELYSLNDDFQQYTRKYYCTHE